MRLPHPYGEYDGDDRLSFKNFSGWTFQDRPEYDFSDRVIYESSFNNETPDTEVFSRDTRGATFIKCNLDNVVIPKGNIVIDCTQRRFKVQNDGNDWEIDEQDNPVIPLIGPKQFLKRGLEVPKPEDIPAEKVEGKAVDLIVLATEKSISVISTK